MNKRKHVEVQRHKKGTQISEPKEVHILEILRR